MKQLLIVILGVQLNIGYASTLVEFKKKAMEISPALKLKSLSIKENNSKKKIGQSGFYPKLGIDMALENETGDGFDDSETTGSAYLKLNLFNQFRDQKLKDKAEGGVKLSALEQANLSNLLQIEIEKLYYEKLYYSSLIQNLQKALVRIDFHLTLIKRRLSAGLISNSDVLEFKLRKSQLKSKMFFYQAEERRILKVLSFITGIKLEDVKKFDRNSLPHYDYEKSHEEEILSNFEKLSPVMRQKGLKMELSQLKSNRAKYRWLPRVDVESRYGRLPEDETLRSSKTETFRVGIYAHWELFGGGKKFAQSNLDTLSNEKSKYEYKSFYRSQKLSLMKDFEELEHIQDRINNDEVSLKLAKELYKKTVSEYKRGVKDSGALASASEAIFEITENIYGFKWEFIKYRLAVEAVTGVPLKVKEVKHAR